MANRNGKWKAEHADFQTSACFAFLELCIQDGSVQKGALFTYVVHIYINEKKLIYDFTHVATLYTGKILN
jgi:hypothetical protein